eukprot:3081082-Rhodomonas_salina.5
MRVLVAFIALVVTPRGLIDIINLSTSRYQGAMNKVRNKAKYKRKIVPVVHAFCGASYCTTRFARPYACLCVCAAALEASYTHISASKYEDPPKAVPK